MMVAAAASPPSPRTAARPYNANHEHTKHTHARNATLNTPANKQEGQLPAWLPSLQVASKEPFGLTSFALSLLLVFRTNASYERWDGARKIWGLLLNRSRDLVRQVRPAARTRPE